MKLHNTHRPLLPHLSPTWSKTRQLALVLCLLLARGVFPVRAESVPKLESYAVMDGKPPGGAAGRDQRWRIARNRTESYDAGDHYLTPKGKRSLHRLAGAVAAYWRADTDPRARARSLTGPGGLLEGYETDVTFGPRIEVLRSPPSKNRRPAVSMEASASGWEALRMAPGVEGANPVFVDPKSGQSLVVSGDIIIRLQDGVDARRYFAAEWGMVRPLSGTTDQYLLRIPGASAEQILAQSAQRATDARVRWAEPDFLQEKVLHSAPNDPLFVEQWHLRNTGQNGATPGADIKALQAWDIGSGANIVIAILDDAIQTDHPDLSPNIYQNPDEINNSIDDDHNGYKDDFSGWNFDLKNNNPRPSSAGQNHGTATAGLAAAAANSLGGRGVAYNSKILPISMLSTTDSETAQAIYYAAGRARNGIDRWRGADVLSISLGWAESSVVDDALHWAATSGRNGKGCPVFVAAGNDGSRWHPYKSPQLGSGLHTFRWEYVKDAYGSAGQDAVWIDKVSFPDGTVEHFEAGLPAGWTTGGNASWYVVTDGESGNHALPSPGSHALRSGSISDSQSTYLQVMRTGAGYIRFWYWISSEFSLAYADRLRFYIDGTLQTPQLDDLLQFPLTEVSYPASHPDTIAVGASSEYDTRAFYSQYGSLLDLVAPGSHYNSIVTTDRTGSSGYETPPGDYTKTFGGTSAACPIAAGVGALVLSANPYLTAAEVRTVLRSTADKIGGVPYPGGRNDYYGYGRVNAFAAVKAAALANLLSPASGGRLLASTSEYNETWSAAHLTDGVKQGVGNSWASRPKPVVPPSFTYSFANYQVARLRYAVVYNYAEPGSAYYSKGVDFHVSSDRITWRLVKSGQLAAMEGPQRFELDGAVARYLKVVVVGDDKKDYWELGEIEVYGEVLPDSSLVLASNGGRLESFTSQYQDSAWWAVHLTDGVKQGVGSSWASMPNPKTPQAFVFGFLDHQPAQLNSLVFYNYAEPSSTHYSKGVEVYVSWDLANWTLASRGELAPTEGAQRFDLNGMTGMYVKAVVTGGYSDDYWELGEIEVYGSSLPHTNVLLPANGGRLVSFTSQYDDSTWPAAQLTDGVKQGVGNSWASAFAPTVPQCFTYGFSDGQVAQLDYAMVYSYGDSSAEYHSKGLEFYVSSDGVSWGRAAAGELVATEGPQAFALGGASGRYLQVRVTSGYSPYFWELGEVEVYGRLTPELNLLAPANGGQLVLFTSQYQDSAWWAVHLTDGVKQGVGSSWASMPNPKTPQAFVFAFLDHQPAQLNSVVVYNYAEPNSTHYSKGLEVYVSWDLANWTLVTRGELAPTEGAQRFDLNGITGMYVKAVVTGSYSDDYWELGEIEIYGRLLPGTNLLPPANGGRLVSFTSEYNPTWVAAHLTDGVGQGVGNSWASKPHPWPAQEFVYTFANSQAARLDRAVVYNFTEDGRSYGSPGIEFYRSWDGLNWVLLRSGELEQREGPQVFGLDGAHGRYVKVVVVGDDKRDYWELGEIEVYGALLAERNLILPANGGRLESFTSQYKDSAWWAVHLADGVKQGVGSSWASEPYPKAPQAFVFGLADHKPAQLDSLVLYNYAEPNSTHYSKGVEFWISADGVNWTLLKNGVLTPAEGPQTFDLGGALAAYVKVVVTSGYAQDYWELGEIEVYGISSISP